MLRANEPSRGRDDGRAREHARLGTPTHVKGRLTLAVQAMTVSSAHIEAARRELLWATAALEETSVRTVEQRSGSADWIAKRRSERMQHG